MRKIVIIEDNAVVARLYENKLLAAGNTVKIALDGAEGLRLIHETRPDLVLLDLMLPGMSGVEIIKRIRGDYRFASLPIMAYSSADEDILAQAVEAGSTTIISKNEASFKEILEQFNYLLEASRNWQIYNRSNFTDEDNAEEKPKPAAQNQILIVEDEAITARIVANIAEKEGFNPVVVEDGQEAYRILTSEANFAGAVLDVELPKIKGTDLLKYMRSEKRLRYIPVIMMTASSEYVKLQVESYQSGATFFISKPFERTTFEMIFKTLVKA
jgi:CheY-like chemotaxis protein